MASFLHSAMLDTTNVAPVFMQTTQSDSCWSRLALGGTLCLSASLIETIGSSEGAGALVVYRSLTAYGAQVLRARALRFPRISRQRNGGAPLRPLAGQLD